MKHDYLYSCLINDTLFLILDSISSSLNVYNLVCLKGSFALFLVTQFNFEDGLFRTDKNAFCISFFYWLNC
jgi:hypothetical protein